MTTSRNTVHVCSHAIDRWNERFATVVDNPTRQITKAFAEAVLVGKNDPLPFDGKRKQGTAYYFHAGLAAVFVVDPVGARSVKIVTVVSADAEWLKPKLTREQFRNGFRQCEECRVIYTPSIYGNSDPRFCSEHSGWNSKKRAFVEERRKVMTGY